MPEDSTKRYALVTGAGSGLGRAFCKQLVFDDWHVAVTDVDFSAAEQTLASFNSTSGLGEVHQLDVTDSDAWQRVHDQLRTKWPRLDLIVNNAGVCASGEIGDMPVDVFRRVLDVNLLGVLLGCHTMVPWLKEASGQVVNIASIFGFLAPPSMAAYSVSKAGVIALSETLYGELRPHGVSVTVAIPGFFATQLVEQGQFSDPIHRRIAEQFVRKADVTSEEVVRCTLDAVERGHLYAIIGRKARWLWQLKRLTQECSAILRMDRPYRRSVRSRLS